MQNQQQPLVDSSGRMTQPWWTFFAQQFGPQKIQGVTPNGSPYVFKAQNFRGSLMISGGTVSSVQYSQDGINYIPTGQTAGCFPMAGGDFVKITYSVAPTMNYVPT